MTKRFEGVQMTSTRSKKYQSTVTGIAVATVLAVAVSAHAQVPVPEFSKTFTPDTIGPGSIAVLRFDIVNQDTQPVSDIAFSDTLPAGMTIATPASAFSNCTDAALSAPDGGTTISMIGARLGASSACIVSVNVTASSTGLNTSGDLTSSAGNSGPATDTLTVNTSLPGFSKSFAPSSIPLGGTSTLTLTVDNTANPADIFSLNFTDLLPSGMIIAAPANAATDCTSVIFPANLTAASGTNIVSLFATGFASQNDPVVAAGSSCTVTVNVTTDTTGSFVNTTGPLMSGSSSAPSGTATATLAVPVEFLGKSFIDDPVIPGGVVTLEFTVTNLDRLDPATSISFDDDLESVLTGLSPAGALPASPCGAGSSLSFAAGTLSLTGGNLPISGSCTFAVSLAVPGAATNGAYTNTTSAISMDIGGSSVVGNTATDTLFISSAPVLTKEFTDDPVGAGGSVTLEFNITNSSSTAAATDITFDDNFYAGLPTATATPAPGFCGAGSTATFTPLFNPPAPSDAIPARLSVTGASLAPSASCTFSITLDVAPGVPTGTYANVTTPITATIGGETVIGLPAVDTLEVAGGPRLLKEFTDDPVQPGDTVTLEFTLTHDPNATADATGIAFTDDLSAALAGLVATGLPINDVCGAGSQISGTTSLSFTGGSLAPAEACTFSVTLQVPVTAPIGSHTNTTSSVSATVGGVTVTDYPASDDLMIAGLVLTKEFTDDPAFPGGPVTVQFTIENISPVEDATDILFNDDLDNVIPGLTAIALPPADICGTGSSLIGLSGNTLLRFFGGTLLAGESCTFSVTLAVPGGALSDTYINTTDLFSATIAGSTVLLTNASDLLVVSADRLLITKSFIDDPAPPGGTATLEFTLANLDPALSATGISFTDDLNAALPGLAATGLPMNDVCGAGSQISGTGLLTLTGGNLGPGATCTFSVATQIPVAAPAGSYTNVTGQVTGVMSGLPVTGDPASDDLSVSGFAFSKAFGGPVPAGGTTTLSFTIENLDPSAGAVGISFTDDLDLVVPGMVAVGLPMADVCGPGSSLAGTSFLTFTGGNLRPGGSCTFAIDVQIPSAAPEGTFTNITSDLSQGGIPSAEPAAADIVVEPALLGVEIPVTTPLGTLVLVALIAVAALWRLRWTM